jgi:hypothetical protein
MLDVRRFEPLVVSLPGAGCKVTSLIALSFDSGEASYLNQFEQIEARCRIKQTI